MRATLGLRANCLARGHSGLRQETLQRIIELLDASYRSTASARDVAELDARP